MSPCRILIGIAGGSGSGKTLVARTIVKALGSEQVVIIDQDSYYKNLGDIPFRDRDARNFDHPDAFDNDLLKRHIRDLLAGLPVEQPVYDYAEHRRLAETRSIGDHLVIVLEGILIFGDPAKRHADVIIPEGGHNKVAAPAPRRPSLTASRRSDSVAAPCRSPPRLCPMPAGSKSSSAACTAARPKS